MSRSLLDVNVLLALVDAHHVDHDRVHDWAEAELAAGWATCPLTENGFVRILSQPAYPNAVTVREAVAILREATRAEAHEFWPCNLSLLSGAIDESELLGHRQITDAYLVALAASRNGRFVTLARSVPLRAVPSAAPSHLACI